MLRTFFKISRSTQHTHRSIAREMIGHGRSPQTPAMAVRWATRPDQQTIVGTLGDLPDKLEQAHMRPPATIVIGEVVSLRDRFNWYEKLPLFGQRIIVTRDRRQSPLLAEPLEALGAETTAEFCRSSDNNA